MAAPDHPPTETVTYHSSKRLPLACSTGFPILRTTMPVAAAVSARVAITLGGLQPVPSRVLNQISASVDPSAVPPYQASAIRPSASSASVLAWENGATFGSFSETNSAGKDDTTGAGGAAKRGGATDGARQNAKARATKKKTATTFS